LFRAALSGIDAMVCCTMAWADRWSHGQGQGTVGFLSSFERKIRRFLLAWAMVGCTGRLCCSGRVGSLMLCIMARSVRCPRGQCVRRGPGPEERPVFLNPGIRCARSIRAGWVVLLAADAPWSGDGRRGRFYWVGGREHLPPCRAVAAVFLARTLQVQRFRVYCQAL
jgi:hypothetical protein